MKQESPQAVSRARNSKTYYVARHECPGLFKAMMQDLMRIDGFSEVDIAFGSGVSIEIVRECLFGRQPILDQRSFLALLSFFSRFFCRNR